ncbi:hypothetical protein PHMEG_00041900 [Phytophthora megakarya]|uniref:Uncharacterized protein n=1 Tax=Phytophthora megakarya TaxID=4795 RepID=A0A225UA32_9STRA|nr:hypothetical protein PHMEG_00041900 [Phytophthora megakarya]
MTVEQISEYIGDDNSGNLLYVVLDKFAMYSTVDRGSIDASNSPLGPCSQSGQKHFAHYLSCR